MCVSVCPGAAATHQLSAMQSFHTQIEEETHRVKVHTQIATIAVSAFYICIFVWHSFKAHLKQINGLYTSPPSANTFDCRW